MLTTKYDIVCRVTGLGTGVERDFEVVGAPRSQWPTLESEIAAIQDGVVHVFQKDRHSALREHASGLIDQMYEMYRAGDVDGGFSVGIRLERLLDSVKV